MITINKGDSYCDNQYDPDFSHYFYSLYYYFISETPLNFTNGTML